MAEVYASVHATACFFQVGFGKSCPNSIIESFACGRPVLLSDTCGIAGLVADRKAGVSMPRTVEALSAGLETLRADFERRRTEARRLAESCFGVQGFLRNYANLYSGLVA